MICSSNKLFCGPPSLGPKQFWGKCNKSGVSSWFKAEKVYYVHKARVAIHKACELLRLDKESQILAPAYNCGSEIDALKSSGTNVVLYKVNTDAQTDLSDLRQRISQRTRAIYVIHYFGFAQPVEEIRKICEEEGIYLIEDCALSLFSYDETNKLGSVGDISVFNFPKALPVPDGGAMVINNRDLAQDAWILNRPQFRSVARSILPFAKRYVLRSFSGNRTLYPLLWHLLKRTHLLAEQPRRTPNMQPEMPASYYYDYRLTNRAISAISKRAIERCDATAIVKRRRKNFNLYLSLISGTHAIKPLFKNLPDGVCPLHFPVIVANRKQICQKLNELSIAAIEWWSGYHRDFSWDEYPNACFLKDKILALPLHQQLNDRHIEFIVHKLIDFVTNID